ncbi:nucleoporin 88-like [Saccoglossus kowalevskii]|uniref:Nuclear pore complex protein Nup88-like n=1 Tax=Saccoglossus kowalevskii TaxID=10224 RepID=A0ABM0GKC8_SACKO|nr:PREDICTED: nuclear pore complex protein Nup88-like [Saccoglossus kowalevskii]
MATASWRSALNSHPVFSDLQENNAEERLKIDSRNLLEVGGSELFVWDPQKSHLLTTNLKNLLDTQVEQERSNSYQTLLCTNPPRFAVCNIALSPTCCHLALSGQHGVSILELPSRWGKYADFEGGKSNINCRTIPIAERFFTTQSSVLLLQASWHPGSQSDTHIMLLTSDNLLRVFELNDPQSVYQIYSLGEPPNNLHTMATFEEVLGEIAVSFDFGPPLESTPCLESTGSSHGKQKAKVYPVYVLRGNGDVYYLTVSMDDQSTVGYAVQGPLSMYPPAEDNYGLDACNIICLHSNPPVLVIATSTGNLYHCIVLSKSDEDDDTGSQSWRDDLDFKRGSDLSLYVYENVELELSLSLDHLEEDMTCPITLHRDPTTTDRYHCSHGTGVHSVAITWLPKLQQLCVTEDEGSLLEFSQDQSCIAEHLVCTRPTSGSLPAPIQGLCIVYDKLLGITLICLTSHLECVALPLVNLYQLAPPLMSASFPSQKSVSPLRVMSVEPFDRHIKKILQRHVTNPVLKSHPETELTPQECCQVLNRATQVFREEYIIKQEVAREEIAKRIMVLRDQKMQQLQELKDFEEEREQISSTAEEIAEKLEDAKENQTQLNSRIKTILKNLEARLPVLSDAEQNMKKELSTMEGKLKHHKNVLQQVKTKEEYQSRQISRMEKKSSNRGMSQSHTKHLHAVLKEEGDKISSLVKQVHSLKSLAGE